MTITDGNAWRKVGETLISLRPLNLKERCSAGVLSQHTCMANDVDTNRKTTEDAGLQKYLVRRIGVVKRADKRRMEELRVTVGMNESFKKKFVRSMLIWTCHVERMGDGKLAKRAVTPIVERKKQEVRKTEIAMGLLKVILLL